MSKADEMFKELGYEKETEYDYEFIYRKYEKHIFKFIRFWKLDKEVIKQDEDGRYMGISMQELQAINEKVKELGWID